MPKSKHKYRFLGAHANYFKKAPNRRFFFVGLFAITRASIDQLDLFYWFFNKADMNASKGGTFI